MNRTETIQDMEHEEELGRRTDALAEKKRPGNVASFSKLGDQWRRMGDALESLVRISTPGPGNSLKKPGTVV